MNTTPFNIHAPNSYGVGMYLNVVPEVKEGYVEFQVLDNDYLVMVLAKPDNGEWEFIDGEFPGEVDFGFLTGQIDSNFP